MVQVNPISFNGKQIDASQCRIHMRSDGIAVCEIKEARCHDAYPVGNDIFCFTKVCRRLSTKQISWKSAMKQNKPKTADNEKMDTSNCRVLLDSAGRAMCHASEPCQHGIKFISTRFCTHPSVKKIIDESRGCI